jgi:VanZ family protein
MPISNISYREEVSTVAHILAYSICSYLWGRTLGLKRKYWLLMAIFVPLSEILQLPLLYRKSSIGDLMANMMGVIVGSIISYRSVN